MRITALLPTYNRREFIPAAINCFLNQEYPIDWKVFLIILDDGTDPIKDLVLADPRIQYHYELPRRNHGGKMNRLAELATGEILVVFDDDDQYSPDRLVKLAEAFKDPVVQVVGSSALYYQDGEKTWLYTSPKEIGWLSSIAFRKTTIEKYPFESLVGGADWKFQQKVRQENPAALVDLKDPSLVVARVHAGNVCRKRTADPDYVLVS